MFLRPLPLVLALFFAKVQLPLEDSASIASDPVPAAKTPAASDSPVLKRILASWREREERMRSFYFAWDTKWIPPKKSGKDIRVQGRTEIWMDAEWRYAAAKSWPKRPENNSAAPGTQQTVFVPSWQHTFDGVSNRTFDVIMGTGRVYKADPGIELGRMAVGPLLLSLRPFSHGGSEPKRFRVITENAIVENRHCVKLERTQEGTVEAFWIDPSRDDVIVGWDRRNPTSRATYVAIEYQRDREYGWVPRSWTETYYQLPEQSRIERTVVKWEINQPLAAERFSTTFPPGSTVLDEKTLEEYLIAEDGSKTRVKKIDSPESLKIYEILGQVVDFQIDQEPLSDALEFIAQRYQIKVTFDAQAVHDKLIDPTIDVKLPVSGIKLRSCLNLVLEQSRKPLAYEIRNGALIIVPAARAK